MTKQYIDYIASQLAIASWQVSNCVDLLSEGATIPFISRYRKERTGGIDETYVAQIKHYFLYFSDLDKRKASILKSIELQGLLTENLSKSVDATIDMQALEDIYLPYKPKRRTRASIAKEKGLEPLAQTLYNALPEDIYMAAEAYCNESVPTKEDALSGAKDIIAEWISENSAVRSQLRNLYLTWGTIVTKVCKGKEEDEKSDKYRSFFAFSQRVDRVPPYRLLALLRAEAEEVITVKIEVNTEYVYERIDKQVLRNMQKRPYLQLKNFLQDVAEDAYKRLLHSSIENEVFAILKGKADIESIKLFGENLRQLLLAPPIGQKRTLAIDPGFRTGCKVVCLDAEGNLLHNDTIYPHPPINEKTMAMKKISHMVESYKIEVIAIGNGTAGRETDNFIKKIALPPYVRVYSVSEDGASVYSASDIAREEFAQYDVTVRGAVSIGRRLMDPLAELVKIDPKSIGVGQYQHDVDQSLLKEALDNTVESCVNSVGVNLNTASKHLLRYVSGIGHAIAQNIVDYRSENGAFTSRQQLLKVKMLGPKAFEQCAGFLRIAGADNPLDNSAVHPERYALVENMAADMGLSLSELISNDEKCSQIDVSKYQSDIVGLLTLNDIVKELSKPGRDPRSIIKVFEFSEEIKTIEDLIPGMELPAIVTNITDFGAFVDLGIKQNGLIHISKMNKVLKIHQQIHVKVESVDLQRQRISLSLLIE